MMDYPRFIVFFELSCVLRGDLGTFSDDYFGYFGGLDEGY